METKLAISGSYLLGYRGDHGFSTVGGTAVDGALLDRPALAVMKSTSEVVRVKTAFAWIEQQRAIHLKAQDSEGHPVELTAEETRRLAERLLKLADVLDALQRAELED